MAKHQGRVVGDVTYREGDGVEMKIPRGAVEVDRTPLDATISWTDGATRGSTAIPLADLKRHVDSGALVIGAADDGSDLDATPDLSA
jgi:hypothetical protein